MIPRRLARERADVIVLERARLGQEASWAAAGMIAPQAEAQTSGVFFDLCLAARRVFDATIDLSHVEEEIVLRELPDGTLHAVKRKVLRDRPARKGDKLGRRRPLNYGELLYTQRQVKYADLLAVCVLHVSDR